MFTSQRSTLYDKDGNLGHKFYEDTVVTKNGQNLAKLRWVHKNLISQGIVKLDSLFIVMDLPVIL